MSSISTLHKPQISAGKPVELDPTTAFLVSSLRKDAGKTDKPGCMIVCGARNAQAALSAYLRCHPDRNPISAVSLAEMQEHVRLVSALPKASNCSIYRPQAQVTAPQREQASRIHACLSAPRQPCGS